MSNWWNWNPPENRALGSFAVIGVGRFGTALCLELSKAGADVLAIDNDPCAVDRLNKLDPSITARKVDSTDEEALREAGVLDVHTVVVAMSEPIEVSITVTLIAKDSSGSRVERVIARATNDLHNKMLQRVGADRVIFPSKMQGQRLGQELVRPNLLDRLRLDDRTSIEEIRVPEEFIGKSLRDINLRKSFHVSVLAAGPDNQLTVNPPATHVVQRNELLVVMGASEDLAKLPGR
jgi:trk system potassium uptake protein TrkA